MIRKTWPSPSPEELLSANRKVQKRAIEQIYAYCNRYLRSMPGIEKTWHIQASDILQDAITVVFQNLRSGSYEAKSSINTYTLSICKKLWLYKQRSEFRMPKSGIERLEELQDDDPEVLQTQLLTNVLQNLSPGCQALLKDFYFETLSMEEISKKHTLQNSQIAKNKKWRCMKRLIEIVKSYNLEKEDFYR